MFILDVVYRDSVDGSPETTQENQPGNIGNFDTHREQKRADMGQNLPGQGYRCCKRVSQKNSEDQAQRRPKQRTIRNCQPAFHIFTINMHCIYIFNSIVEFRKAQTFHQNYCHSN